MQKATQSFRLIKLLRLSLGCFRVSLAEKHPSFFLIVVSRSVIVESKASLLHKLQVKHSRIQQSGIGASCWGGGDTNPWYATIGGNPIPVTIPVATKNSELLKPVTVPVEQ